MDALLENTIKDLVSGLMYYDRKEDEQLPRGAIEGMVSRQETDVDEIIDVFSKELRIRLGTQG
jgi:hypothetical protein